MSKNIRRLPDSELEVMQAVWACSPQAGTDENIQPVSRGQIEEILQGTRAASQPPEPSMALTTLLTLLTRLSEKGFIRTEKIGRSNCYTPLISQADYLASQSRSFLDKLCGGSISTFASALCDSGLTKEELEELAQLLERSKL